MTSRFDQQHINDAATWAAGQLAATGVARVDLTPGDMTEYRLLIAAPCPTYQKGVVRPPRDQLYTVAVLNDFGAGYEWTGEDVDDGYAAEKWTKSSLPSGGRTRVGAVVAAFLHALGRAIAQTSAKD